MSDATTVQTRLAALGLYTGRIDGAIGPASLRAILAALDGTGEPVAQAAPSPPLDPETVALTAELRQDEGCRLAVYKDKLGYWTIGVGRLVDSRRGGGITSAEADILLANDIERTRADLDKHIPWWRRLDTVRRRALQNMCFQMGIGSLLEFGTSLPMIEAGDYAGAARNLRKSLWARQTPERAERVIHMIETGVVR